MSNPADITAHQPVRSAPLPGVPPRYEGNEAAYLLDALHRNRLWYLQSDGYVNRMLAQACAAFGSRHAVAASSGSAALHVAVAGAGVQPGDEVITAGITDMGSVIGILQQNAVPVFADVDPDSSNLTAATIEAAITERTRAVIVVHLAGVPCEMEAILALCRKRNIVVIEDAAQAWASRYQGRYVGTLGDLGAFSLNDSKTLSCGDGGFILTNDEARYQTCHLFADKHYDRLNMGVRLHGLGVNYRMSELQGAVGLAQLERMDSFTEPRRELGAWLNEALSDVPGVVVPRVPAGAEPVWWFYMFRVDEQRVGMSRDDFAARLKAEGLPASAGYLPRPLYHERVFVEQNFFPGGVWPATLVHGQQYDYGSLKLPGTELACATCVRLPLHQGMSQCDVEDYAKAIRKAAARK